MNAGLRRRIASREEGRRRVSTTTRLVAIGATAVAVVVGVAYAQPTGSTASGGSGSGGSGGSATTNGGSSNTGTGSSDNGSQWNGPQVTTPDNSLPSHGSTGGS